MKVVILFALLSVANFEKIPTVDVPFLGKIEGSTDTSLNGREFYTFEGVPYARPPVGEHRFKEPVTPRPWKGTWEAKTMHKCMQYNQYASPGEDPVIGDEDCLYVNIYTPTLNNNANLDVIVYIHGGAFMFLYGGFYGPNYLLKKNVVYINFNYRLGPLGFLSTEDDLVPGNNGIKDQILALKWIKDHVKHFGGNPSSITIFGMSAGGASVHIHYLSPKSKGLFHRGISQSGTALNPWVLMEKGLEKTKKLASNLGCSTTGVEMVDCLRQRPGRQIVASVKEFQPWLYNPFSPFGVVVDSWASDPVLSDHPINIIKKGQVADLPWIVSQTNFEGLYPASDFLQDRFLKEIDKRWNDLLPFILDYNHTVNPKLRDQVSQKIRKHYLGAKQIDRSSLADFINILSDRLFALDIQKTAKMQTLAVQSSVFFYVFEYCGAHFWYETQGDRQQDFGAAHAEDTAYVLKTPTADTASNDEDKRMIEVFVELFTSFAKTGVPKGPVEWTPLSKDSKKSIEGLKIVSPSKLSMDEFVVKDAAFWEDLPIRENEKLLNGDVKDEL